MMETKAVTEFFEDFDKAQVRIKEWADNEGADSPLLVETKRGPTGVLMVCWRHSSYPRASKVKQKPWWGRPLGYTREPDIRTQCCLCMKRKDQVSKLIVGMHGAVCADCVKVCADILNHPLA